MVGMRERLYGEGEQSAIRQPEGDRRRRPHREARSVGVALQLVLLVALALTVQVGDRVLTTNEVLEKYRIPRDTFYAWRKSGRGPKAYRAGRSLRFRESECEAWFESLADPQPAA